MKNKTPGTPRTPTVTNGRCYTSIRLQEAQLRLLDTAKSVFGYTNRGDFLMDFLVQTLESQHSDKLVVAAALKQYQIDSAEVSIETAA